MHDKPTNKTKNELNAQKTENNKMQTRCPTQRLCMGKGSLEMLPEVVPIATPS